MTRIRLSTLSSAEHFESPNDYGTIKVQGGTQGLVVNRSGPSYRTAFIECFPEGSFIRGEGATLEDADKSCFSQLSAYLTCTNHEWEPRGYRNGGGICARCGQFGSGVFTPDELGLRCRTCGTPTFHTARGISKPVCEEHDERWPYFIAWLRVSRNIRSDEDQVLYGNLLGVHFYGDDLAPTLLADAERFPPLPEDENA